jgi:SH3-like domain-containing protein
VQHGSARASRLAWIALFALLGVTPACRQAEPPPADYEPAAPAPAAEAPRLESVTASRLNVRAGPGAEHPVVGRLERGARVRVLEESSGWKRVQPEAGGLEGWVAGDYLQAAPNP